MFSSSSRQILYSKSEKNRHEIDSFDLEHIRIDKYDGGTIGGEWKVLEWKELWGRSIFMVLG
jgi:hypothetical protein